MQRACNKTAVLRHASSSIPVALVRWWITLPEAKHAVYIVNQPIHSFRMLEQTHSVFSLRNEVIAKLSSHCKEFKYLKDDVLAKVNALGYLTKKPEEPAPDAPQTTRVSLQRIDLLLNWTRNSHYLMHKDSIDSHGMCYLTVIVNITPYASTLLVAGAKNEVSLDTIGKGCAFPGKLFHRSGETRRGTIKLAFFFSHVNDPEVCSSTKPKNTVKGDVPSSSASDADKGETKPVSPKKGEQSSKLAGKQPKS